MAKLALSLLLLHFFALSLHFGPTQTSALTQDDSHPNPNSSFIRSSCRATPAICIHTLTASVRRNDLRLSRAALLVALSCARSTTSFVAGLVHAREFMAIKDCVENIGDSVDSLTRSVAELPLLGKRVEGSVGTGVFVWHMSNVQTRVSAVLTDKNTCVDGNIKVSSRHCPAVAP